MLIKDHVGWALLQQALIMYWCIRDVWGPVNLVASTIAELNDTLPRFTDDRSDSVRATRVASMAHVCRVVRFFPLQGDY
jgi:hypothetical protein